MKIRADPQATFIGCGLRASFHNNVGQTLIYGYSLSENELKVRTGNAFVLKDTSCFWETFVR